MNYIDVFNGDADGIFSLIQWRKAHPIHGSDKQHLVTGVKRDISLVQQITDDLAFEAPITVLDVSFDKNVDGVKQVLEVCQSLFYCDHHKADKLFEHEKLTTKINTEPTVCTGLLLNAYLQDKYPLWAVASAYGDGLDSIAKRHIQRLNLNDSQQSQLKKLGVLVNYNGYGSSVEDLHFDPAEMFNLLANYESPFDIVQDKESPFLQLEQGYIDDMTKVESSENISSDDKLVALLLEDAAWARRISGTYGNQLAAKNPDKPVIIASHNAEGSLAISLRAPKNNPYGASTICSQFATGGGREGAAGVNKLPKSDIDAFIDTVSKHYLLSK
ncbi:DHH family phosphoesterase [Psychrobacter sp.]|uniref:DHH family phosphoesterase n=1 Tax=Psychrobacter sp. TaxID=56811 RepID=UPI003F9A3FFA